ncbi:MAG TPA: YtxH domain-containing protein [Candidatus Binatia bacterium]|nr:YtxH domain-containing protein [Candidatus Binatia bacterium]
MGYLRGFIHGALAGTVLGLCVAPQTGERTRAQLSVVGRAARNRALAAQRTVKQVAPVVGGAASVARGQMERMRRRNGAPVAGRGAEGDGHR